MRSILRTYRSLLKRPALFLAVVVTLTLGIGANSAIFSVIDAVLLKPLPYPGADRLMALFESNPRKKMPKSDVAPVRLEDWNRMNHSFTAIAGAYTENVAETSGDLPEMLVCARVSPRFFSVLGTPPIFGRTLNREEDQMNGPNAAVISEHLWRRRFAADPRVIGKNLRVGEYAYPIVGVMPDSVAFPETDVDFWIPARLPAVVMRNREARFASTIGRLQEGIGIAKARADLAGVQANLARQFPATDANWTPVVEPLKEQSVGGVRKSLWILFGAVSLVLLIACANVACLLLAQASRRSREIALRFSLGAGRGRVIRELLQESFCLALPGALGGLLLAALSENLLHRAAVLLPRVDEIRLDWRLVLFALSLSVITTILFGLLPSLGATRAAMAGSLAQGSRTQVGGRHSIQRMLVSLQIALAIVLLAGAGLFIRSLWKLGEVPLGFQPDNILSFHISASWGEVNNLPRVVERQRRTLETLRNTPGVEAAAIALGTPGAGEMEQVQFSILGQNTDAEGTKVFADYHAVTPGYFAMLTIPLQSGSVCAADADTKTRPEPALVSRSFADRYFPSQNPIGQQVNFIRRFDSSPLQIVGVVSDVHEYGYAKDPAPTVYSCGLPWTDPDPAYLVKATGDPLRLLTALKEKIHQIEPSRAVYGEKRLTDYLASTLAPRRFQIALLGAFAATALLLAAIGLYGVMTFVVSQRTREIGLRAALGARPLQIFALIFRQGALMTGAGIVAGLVAAAVLSRLIERQLFGIDTLDPITFTVIPVVLASVAAIALWIPARRATEVDPMEALRHD